MLSASMQLKLLSELSGERRKGDGKAGRLLCFKLVAPEVLDQNVNEIIDVVKDDSNGIVQPLVCLQPDFVQPTLVDGMIQCGCCCGDASFENMVQCLDGHLFCIDCLRRRIEESTFGSLSACGPLACMDMMGCNKYIPWSEIHRAIEPGLLLKYEHRQACDSLTRAKLRVAYCPFCDVACEVDPRVLTFSCPNESCRKASCIICKEPAHEPLHCQEIEKPAEAKMRIEVEEAMSQSLIRECTACKAQLIKTGGCNKLTCRCGHGMCYVCRQPINDYRHYCEHLYSLGNPCRVCNKCSLWAKENDAAVVLNAKRAVMKIKAKENPDIWRRLIGPAESFFHGSHRKK